MRWFSSVIDGHHPDSRFTALNDCSKSHSPSNRTLVSHQDRRHTSLIHEPGAYFLSLLFVVRDDDELRGSISLPDCLKHESGLANARRTLDSQDRVCRRNWKTNVSSNGLKVLFPSWRHDILGRERCHTCLPRVPMSSIRHWPVEDRSNNAWQPVSPFSQIRSTQHIACLC